MDTPASLLAGLTLLAATSASGGPVVVFDLEGSFDGWTIEGAAFGETPARGTLPDQMAVTGQRGEGYANSFHGGDAAVGTLTSPPFRVGQDYLRFLRGGGMDPQRLQVNLLSGGEIVRTATGTQNRPGGSERLEWVEWDVSDLRGVEVRLQIVDAATGGWGHLTLDHVVHDDAALPPLGDVLVPIRGEGRFLNLPVATGDPSRRVDLLADGEAVRWFDIQLSDQPEFWVSLPVETFGDAELSLRVADARAGDLPFTSLERADAPHQADLEYREPLRPQFHFTARRGWINDPNGMVYADGLWHLYFQHNPYAWHSGQKHWGHAVSTDLLHWRELDTAIHPHSYGDEVYSGTAVVDENNTSGFGTGDRPPIVAAYTSTGRGECIAYSNDGGNTFAEYESNPVVVHEEVGRDPRLVWDAQRGEWIMAIYRDLKGKQWIAFWTSPDLKSWSFRSDIEDFYECPDLRRLPVDGDADNARWLLYAANGEYLLGDWDGHRFTPTTSRKQKTLYGDFYAGQTFTHAPGDRMIYLGWHFGSEAKGAPFNQQMTALLDFELRDAGDEGVRMFANPIPEYEQLRGEPTVTQRTPLAGGESTPIGEGEHLDVELAIELGDARFVGVSVRGRELLYDADRRLLTFGDIEVPLSVADGELNLRLLIDALSVEVFAEDGYAAVCDHLPTTGETEIAAFAREGIATLKSATVYPMRSIWPQL